LGGDRIIARGEQLERSSPDRRQCRLGLPSADIAATSFLPKHIGAFKEQKVRRSQRFFPM
jgi:hypothetical protein